MTSPPGRSPRRQPAHSPKQEPAHVPPRELAHFPRRELAHFPRRELAHFPRVAILGRPNVGKSTLFNVLLGRRRAITYSDPGVTRDPIEVECRLGGARMTLVDTGGYTSGAEGIDGVVAERSLKTAREADLVEALLHLLTC